MIERNIPASDAPYKHAFMDFIKSSDGIGSAPFQSAYVPMMTMR